MIANIDVSLFESPIVVPFAISRETKDTARIVIIRLADEQGRQGLGEASPFVSLTGDTAEVAFAEAMRLKDELQHRPFGAARARLDEIYADSRRRSATAVVGFEMAFFALAAQRQGRPLWQVFGPGPRRSYLTDITLPILPPAGIERFWAHFASYEFPVIKIKVSGNVAADLDMISTFYRIVGREIAFSLDGNQGFDVGGSLKLLDGLQAMGRSPLFFEQPLPAEDWSGLAALTRRSTTPICLDETVKSCADLRKAKELGAGGMINLKVMKAGLAETERMVHEAQRLGLKLMIGGMLESEIAMGVSLQLVNGTGLIEHLDLDTPFFFERHPTPQSPWHAKKATLDLGD